MKKKYKRFSKNIFIFNINCYEEINSFKLTILLFKNIPLINIFRIYYIS